MAKHVFKLLAGRLYHEGEFIRLTEHKVVTKSSYAMRGESFTNRHGALIVETDDPDATKAEYETRRESFRDRVDGARTVVKLIEDERRAYAMASLKFVEIEEPAGAK